jgi:hypothetical protein
MIHFNSEHKAVLDEMLLDHPLVRPGKMFGYPAYYVGKKVCICMYQQGISVKLPRQTVEKLLDTDPNAAPFQPNEGRIMREWVLITLNQSSEYRRYQPLFEESIHFVFALGEKDS